MFRSFLLLAILSGSTTAQAAEALLDLGGCENKVYYDPGVFTIGTAALAAYDRAFPREPADDGNGLEQDLAGMFRDPRTGGVWFLLANYGMSCDPSYVLKPADPRERSAEFLGEVMHIGAGDKWKLRAKFNLYFEIERTISWSSGRPVEVVPYFYPVRRKTKSLVVLPLFPDKTSTAPKGSIAPGVTVTVLGCGNWGSRALIHSADGKTGWIDLDDNALLEGVAFYGD